MKNSVIEAMDVDALYKKVQEATKKGETDWKSILIPLMDESPVLLKAMHSGATVREVAADDLEARIEKHL